MAPQKLERILSEEDFRKAIARAEAFRAHDEFLKDGEQYREALRQLGSPEGVSVSRAYQIAQELDIPRDYFERALKMNPGKEEMRKDLERIGAKPHFDLLVSTYQRELSKSIQEAFPSDEFEAVRGDDYPQQKIFMIKKIIKRGKLFVRTKILTTVEIKSHSSKDDIDIDIDIYSHDFVAGCAETLKGLDERFGRTSELKFHYDVYGKES
ncbi:MAG: hypothetical protein AABX91_00960 [Nanoarchaeota archaeon]